MWLAEDDDAMRELLRRVLLKQGFLVQTFSDGAELERSFEELRPLPDVLVLDHHMPKRLGLDVVAEVRQRFPSLPVILITAFGDDATHARARVLGVRQVLDKPFDIEDLTSALSQILGRVSSA